MTSSSSSPKFITDDLDCYLASGSVVDWHDSRVIRQAKAITVSCSDDTAKADALYTWVRDNIPHTRDAAREEVTCAASEVLAAGTGICYAKCHLLAAMLRSVGIPAGFCYQVYEEPLHVSVSKIALHGLVGVYLSNIDKWIRLDCRGNTGGIDAHFDTETERLAFPDLEFFDNRIYFAPLMAVIDALQTWPTCTTLWPHLPQPPRDAARLETAR